jgi:DNA-binding GntR family transcriptional regulator
LNIPEDSLVLRFRRTRINRGVPSCYVVNYIPLVIGEKIRNEDLLKSPMLKILRDQLMIPIRGGYQSIEAVAADHEIASVLSIPMCSPILYVETSIFAKRKKPVEFTQMFLRSDRYKFAVKLRVTKGLKEGVKISLDR